MPLLIFKPVYRKAFGLRSIILILLLASIAATSSAQTHTIDSLTLSLAKNPDEVSRLHTLFAICGEHESLSADTLNSYANLALITAQKIGDKEKILRAQFYTTLYLFKKNKLDTTLAVVNSLIAKYSALAAYNEMYIGLYVLKFNIHWRKNNFNEAVATAQELIKLAEKNKDEAGLIKGYVCLGTAHHIGSNHPDEGLKWYMEALALMNTEPEKTKYAMVYSNIAIAYEDIVKDDSVKIYLTEGLRYARKGDNLSTLARALRLYSAFMADNGNLVEAAATIREATAVQKRIGDIFGTVRAMRGEADFYMGAKQYTQAIAILSEATTLAEKNGIEQMMTYDLYNALSIAYDSAGDHRNSVAILRQMLQIKDSNYKANTAVELAALQTKFDLQKKETQIVNQQLEILRKNILLAAVALLLLILSGISFLLFRNYKKKQKQRMTIALEEEKKLRATEIKEAESKERKRIAADLHDNLGVQANAIMHNAAMLQQDQSDKNKVGENLQQMAKEMLLNLRETLWAMKSDNITAGEAWIRIINFSQMMARQYKHIQIQTIGEAPLHTLASPQALNMVMIVQEAVSNAIQHSHATLIQTISDTTNNNWKITVTDNGSGFDYAEARAKADHYGLIHLKERAAAGNIDLQVTSSQGKGTVITLLIPVK